ncbi:MAG: peptidylprolyl isomerase [Chlamydiae bacterium]|nr:peptidylprolyl isomerase [Chlamydiota bacterium]
MEEKVTPHLNSFILYVVFLLLVIIGIILLFSTNTVLEEKQASGKAATPSAKQNMGKYKNPPKMEITQNKQYRAVMETSKGSLKIELFAKETPQTVNNFAFLAKNG